MEENGAELENPSSSNTNPDPNPNSVESGVELENCCSPNRNPDPDSNPVEEFSEEKPIDEEMVAGEGVIETSQLPDDEASEPEPEPEPVPGDEPPVPEPEPEPEVEPVPVKRKRGRPPKSQSMKAASAKKKKVEGKKKDEEDVCFICFDGGNLVVCDRRGCPKVYHPVCVNRDETFFQTTGRWNCGWHICSICEKAAHYMCYTCTYSLCKGCIKEDGFVCIRGNKGFCETCYRTVLLIESNGDASQPKVGVNNDANSSFECLFKYYWFDVKAKLSLTLEELNNVKIPLKGAGSSARNEESSDESYNANEDHGDNSDSSSGRHEGSSSKKKRRGRPRANAAVVAAVEQVDISRITVPEGTEWASKELLEFVGHMKGGDKSVVSQFDVQSLLLQYIKKNNLRDPRRKSQIICDTRLENLFGKTRVAHFEMLKLLESHFLIKESAQVIADDNQGGHLTPDFGQTDAEGFSSAALKLSNDKRRKGRKKVGEREPQANLDDYAAVDAHNINLIYLRRNLIEHLLEDVDNFSEKVVGSFVRIRISAPGQKQDMYRLVQILGTSKAAENYKTGRKTTDFTLEILNLDKKEVITIDSISNQEFTEEECKRLRQSIKCGLISRLTVGEIQEKSRALQAVRVNDWLESEKLRLGHLRDRASETGRRKDLRECVEKLRLLSTPEERRRRLNEFREIHADPNMDPDYESAEEGDTDEKNQDNFNRAGDFLSLKKGRDVISPRGGPTSSNWAGARKSSKSGWELSKNTRIEGARVKLEAISSVGDKTNERSRTQGKDGGQAVAWETGTSQSAGPEPHVWSNSDLAKESGQLHGVTSETTTAFPSSDTSETEKLWYYKDPAENIQGPFNMIQLRKWSPHFPKDTRIWRASENQEDYILLTDALNGKFEKDLPPWEPPQSHHPQAQTGMDSSRPNEQGGWIPGNNTTLFDSKPNRGVWTGTVNIPQPNADRCASQSSSWLAPRAEVVNPCEVRSVISPRGWEPPRDTITRGWTGPPQANNPTLIAPFSSTHEPASYDSYQSNGGRGGGNTGRLNQDQKWGSNLIPGGQTHGHKHSNWSSLGQQPSYRGNDVFNPPTTVQQSNVNWPNAQGAMNGPPSPTPVQPMGAGWGATPSIVINDSHQQPPAAIGWNKAAPGVNITSSWGLNSASKPPFGNVMAGTNDYLGDLRTSHRPNDAAVLGGSTTEFNGMNKNQFFESDCPSPTPRSERQGIHTVQHTELDPQKQWSDANKELGSNPACDGPASGLQSEADNSKSVSSRSAEDIQALATSELSSSEPDANMSPINNIEINLKHPSLSTVRPHDTNGPESLLNQTLDGWAPTVKKQDTNGQSLSPAPSDHKLLQDHTKKPESSFQRPGALKVEYPTDTMKGDEWSLPSPTPAAKPSSWNAIEPEEPSQRGSSTSVKDAPSRSWGVVLQNLSLDTGPARGDSNSGWGTVLQGNTNMGMESLARGNPNLAWRLPAEGNTKQSAGWVTLDSQGGIKLNTSLGFPGQENPNPNMGWGIPSQAKPNPNAGWGTPSQARSNPNTGWATPSQGNTNANTSWGQTNQEGGNTNSGWPTAAGWVSGRQDADDWGAKQNHQQDRYRDGRGGDSSHDTTHGNLRHGGDSRYDSRHDGWRNQSDDRMHRDHGRGGGGGQGGQTGICRFYEGGYCRKGAACKYRHL